MTAGTKKTAGATVRLEHLSRAHGSATILYDVSFDVAAGQLVALTGPSGSGKTTLLQLIGSLDQATSGTIMVDDIRVDQLRNPAGYRRETVGFVFQLHHLLPQLTVQQNVELTMVAAGVPKRTSTERALELLEEVGLGGRQSDFPTALSGGERQRVAIARALAGQPRLILADEPTGALDSVASERIWNLLLDVRANHGTTFIVASHDLTLIEHADREIRLADGRLISDHDIHPAGELA